MNSKHFFSPRLWVIAIFSFISVSVIGQKPVARIAFWNVENFFDTINDPKINDEEFLPDGKMKWTSERYNAKINNLAKVILAIGDGKGPDMLGMSEIENEGVLIDLTQKTDLKKLNYGIVHYDSPDKRGIDVALIYKKDKFKVLDSKAVFVPMPVDTILTRDILVVKGVLNKKDTMWICVNHWPSRRGGNDEASEERRMFAAKKLHMTIVSILKINSHAKIIAIGDFNDEPTNKSIMSLKCPVVDNDTIHYVGDCMTDLMDSLKAAGDGSYHYRKEINMLDNILIDDNFKTKKGVYIINAHIFKQDFMIGTNYKDDPPGPLHTYAGTRYIGGYSDHFPVYADIYR
jgi:predicted extracellular nuclease